ncbi:30S ribosome-binding factor RbfA [Coraliomargarita parva]|uniref:30S ribosome-binding factor RbfA n=1 Tax=Coraliomargarita parva TaxID=3014050 RepID=UPI0022B33F74|nr:30S ribosome-binding factor RbfA [Coraliomargarita parva]
MSKRITRVNELLHREISGQLRRYYRNDAVNITISEVETSTDLRVARVYYSVIGDARAITEAEALFRRIGADLRRRVSKEVVLKYFPKFEYIYDPSLERGANILNLLDELDEENDR